MTQEFHYDENRNLIEGPAPEPKEPTLDANGVELHDGDSIVAIKGLPVKWGTDIKKGTKYSNISLTDDVTHVQAKCKMNGKIFLKTEYFKKVG